MCSQIIRFEHDQMHVVCGDGRSVGRQKHGKFVPKIYPNIGVDSPQQCMKWNKTIKQTVMQTPLRIQQIFFRNAMQTFLKSAKRKL